MRLLGDVSERDRKVAEQLVEFEPQIQNGNYPKEKQAQMYVCLAHDWFQLELEEEGNRLILKAERTCPGYFKNVMMNQTLRDEAFDLVVKSLNGQMASLILHHINDMKGKR